MDEDDRAHRRAVLSTPLEQDRFVPLSSTIALELGAATAWGTDQSANTDHYLAIRIGRLQETMLTSLAAIDLPPRFEEYGYGLLVADGIGDAGARASRVALSALAHLAVRYGRWNVRVTPDKLAEIHDQGTFLYHQAHEAVMRASRAALELIDMATSLTALYIAEAELFIAHVGHSSAYLYRGGTLIELTVRQTLQEARRAGRPVAFEQARTDGHVVVTEALGGRTVVPDIEIEQRWLESGDRLLLCTNGLTEAVSDEAIADTLAACRNPQESCDRLIDLARTVGTHDDATALLADYRIRDLSA
jgi:protein phosphatase